MLWIDYSYFSKKQMFEVKNLLSMDLFLTNTQLFNSQDVDWWTVFISSHTDGTHSLQRIHWWASDGMLNFSKSDEETNKKNILNGLRVKGEVSFLFFVFGVNYSFK